MRSATRSTRPGILLVALSLVYTATARAQSAVITPGRFALGADTVPVDEGRFTVPANRSARGGATLTLRFVRFPTTSRTPRAPIVFLAGGPGDAATRAFRGMPIAFLNELRAIADVIAFDQRGTGGSEPIDPLCPPGTAYPLGEVGDPSRMLEQLRARVSACIAAASSHGGDVAGLTTAESADDLEALRVFIGATQLNLLAGSYGTHLALSTVRRHPQLVQRMVLAGVEGPDDTFKDPARVDAVLARIAVARRPTLMDDLRTLTTRLSSNEVKVSAPNGVVIALGTWDLQRWVAESVDLVPKIDAMVAAIPAMLDNDYRVLARWVAGYRSPRTLNLMNLAMDCASYASPERLAQITAAAPTATTGNAINFPLPQICDVPGLPRLPETFRDPLTSNVHALLISGTFDGRTPVSNAEAIARGMPNARTLVIEGASHGLFREREALSAMVSFLQGK